MLASATSSASIGGSATMCTTTAGTSTVSSREEIGLHGRRRLRLRRSLPTTARLFGRAWPRRRAGECLADDQPTSPARAPGAKTVTLLLMEL